MEKKKIGDVTVNDGNGFFDNEGLCDSLIVDVNNLVKVLLSGQNIAFCSSIVQIVQKLANLKKGISQDMNSLKERIEDQKKLNNELNDELNRMLKEKNKDGVDDGK